MRCRVLLEPRLDSTRTCANSSCHSPFQLLPANKDRVLHALQSFRRCRADAPVTAAVEIVGGKQAMGKGGGPGSTMVVDTAPPEELINDAARDPAKDALPEGAHQPAASTSVQPAANSSVAHTSAGNVSTVSEEGSNVK